MADGLPFEAIRHQAHAELSPILWHIGHVFFVENYWLAERVFGDSRITDRWRNVYFPEECHKSERSQYLPDSTELESWTTKVAAINDGYWQQTSDIFHPLLSDGYLYKFIHQHYAQHLETMRLARAQIGADSASEPARNITSCVPTSMRSSFTDEAVNIGSDHIDAYDNEKPRHRVTLKNFSIARKPVSNAEWLGFIQAGGYDRPEFWCTDGWAWRSRERINKPQHWWTDIHGELRIPTTHGRPVDSAPIHGINWYEAKAFACYAKARLPHETEWEAATRANLLENSGEVWEWCANAFHPYPGFQAFPYDGYSKTWFDGKHRVARGGSILSEAEIKRPSFRNFYPPTHRHVFAGLRLTWTNVFQ